MMTAGAIGFAAAAQADSGSALKASSAGGAGDHICLIGVDTAGEQPSMQVSCTALSNLRADSGYSGEQGATLRLMGTQSDPVARLEADGRPALKAVALYLARLQSSGNRMGLVSAGPGKQMLLYVVLRRDGQAAAILPDPVA